MKFFVEWPVVVEETSKVSGNIFGFHVNVTLYQKAEKVHFIRKDE